LDAGWEFSQPVIILPERSKLGSDYQSVPIDWGIYSERKKKFFKKLNKFTKE